MQLLLLLLQTNTSSQTNKIITFINIILMEDIAKTNWETFYSNTYHSLQFDLNGTINFNIHTVMLQTNVTMH